MKRYLPLILALSACNELPMGPPSPRAAAVSPGIYSDVVYDTVHNLKLDAHIPKLSCTGLDPAVIAIHGGGWKGGSKSNSDVLNYDIPKLKNKCYAVFSIDYRVGNASYPFHLEDVKCAVRYVRAHAGLYGIRPEKIGVLGHSAGGHLAALVGVSDPGAHEGDCGWPVSSRVQAVVTYAGAYDLTRLEDFRDTSQQDVIDVFGSYAFEASPINHVSADDPPFKVFHGDLDPSINIAQAQLMNEALVQAGVSVSFVTVVNGGHYMLTPSGCNCTQVPGRLGIHNQMVAFFDTTIR